MNILTQFLNLVKENLLAQQFVKLALQGYKGREPALKAIQVRKILVKRQERLSFTYQYKTRDIVKNYTLEEATAQLTQWLSDGFTTATLFTTQADWRLEGATQKLKSLPPSHSEVPPLTHDREKQRVVATEGKSYLHALNITDAQGKVLPSAQDKYRQIDKYVEILSGLITQLPAQTTWRVVDMGSGKGYLTFALYDYLANTRGMAAEVIGVEYRQDLVALCNDIARAAEFKGLRFVQDSIAEYDCSGADIVIALHACDTATDDAIAKAIKAEAGLIVVAPCCHKQIRRQMEQANVKNDLHFLTKHGTFLERQAEMVTDGLRAQLMEYAGYQTKLFEFISDAHTPKNVMIVGTKTKAPKQNAALLEAIAREKAYFGIRQHHLEQALS